MLTDVLLSSLRTWAENNPCVLRLWVFGSAVKGKAEPNDLDIAIDVKPEGNDCCSYISRIARPYLWKRWKKQLDGLCPLDVQLCLYSAANKIVLASVAEASILLFTKPATQVEAIPRAGALKLVNC
ncbi:MAG: hypothetical protein ACTS6J_14970, partial [Burkholderiales bacterium]